MYTGGVVNDGYYCYGAFSNVYDGCRNGAIKNRNQVAQCKINNNFF